MGADFCFIALELKDDRETVLKRVMELPLSEEDTRRFAEAGVLDYDNDDTAWELLEPQLRSRLMEAVKVVYATEDRRDCGFFYVDGDRLFCVTGGTSWGDTPSDAWDDFYLVHEYAKELLRYES